MCFSLLQIVFFLLSMCLFCTVACGIWETMIGEYFIFCLYLYNDYVGVFSYIESNFNWCLNRSCQQGWRLRAHFVIDLKELNLENKHFLKKTNIACNASMKCPKCLIERNILPKYPSCSLLAFLISVILQFQTSFPRPLNLRKMARGFQQIYVFVERNFKYWQILCVSELL